jgi:hypothetical protein
MKNCGVSFSQGKRGNRCARRGEGDEVHSHDKSEKLVNDLRSICLPWRGLSSVQVIKRLQLNLESCVSKAIDELMKSASRPPETVSLCALFVDKKKLFVFYFYYKRFLARFLRYTRKNIFFLSFPFDREQSALFARISWSFGSD